MKNIIKKCDCGAAFIEYEVIGEDLYSAVAMNTIIEKSEYGRICICKSCGHAYDDYDHCMVVKVTHK